MSGAVLGVIVAVAAIVVILAAGMAPVLIVPVVLLVAAAVIAVALFGAARKTRITSGPGASGVPSTSEASYDPQVRPR